MLLQGKNCNIFTIKSKNDSFTIKVNILKIKVENDSLEMFTFKYDFIIENNHPKI